jgi:hypothetical protein
MVRFTPKWIQDIMDSLVDFLVSGKYSKWRAYIPDSVLVPDGDKAVPVM